MPVFFPFGSIPNPCDPDPEMLLTVTGSSGTVTWCGQTWNLPADSGVQKSVCPTVYVDSSTGRFRYIRWVYGGSSLFLRRLFDTLAGYGDEKIEIQPNTAVWRDYLRMNTVSTWSIVNVTLGVIYPRTSGMSIPSTSNIFPMVDYMFGSYTNAGITYAWAKGQGW